jgi:phage/plasmid-associated DNA primase
MRGNWAPDTNADQLVRDCLQTNFKGDEDAQQKIDVIQEATGAGMLGCAAHKRAKAIVLWGETADNGKSTVLDFISAAFLQPRWLQCRPRGSETPNSHTNSQVRR